MKPKKVTKGSCIRAGLLRANPQHPTMWREMELLAPAQEGQTDGILSSPYLFMLVPPYPKSCFPKIDPSGLQLPSLILFTRDEWRPSWRETPLRKSATITADPREGYHTSTHMGTEPKLELEAFSFSLLHIMDLLYCFPKYIILEKSVSRYIIEASKPWHR